MKITKKIIDQIEDQIDYTKNEFMNCIETGDGKIFINDEKLNIKIKDLMFKIREILKYRD